MGEQTIGGQIRKARHEAGLTVEQLARLADVPLRQLYRWEADRNEPKLESLARIADALEKPLGFFVPVDAVEKVALFMVRQRRRERMGVKR